MSVRPDRASSSGAGPAARRGLLRRLALLALWPARAAAVSAASPAFRFEVRLTVTRSPVFPLTVSAVVAGAGLLFFLFYSMEAGFAGLSPLGGTVLFLVESLYLLACVLLVSPWLAGAPFAREKRQHTFDLLTSTALPAREVVGAKMLASFLRAALPPAACTPFLVLAVQAGGAGWEEIPKHFALLLSGVLLVAALAVFWSLLFRSVLLTGMVTVLCAVFYAVVVGVGVYLGCRFLFGSGAAVGWLGMTGVSLGASFLVLLLSVAVYRRVSLWDY